MTRGNLATLTSIMQSYDNLLTQDNSTRRIFAAMKARLYSVLFLFVLTLSLFSCEKAEKPVVLPPAGESQMSTVDMGEQYENQIFFSFETNQIVKTSPVYSWDLAFQSDGCHVFMNGGKNIFVYNTHLTDPLLVTDASNVPNKSWLFDSPCGLPDSTALADWRLPNGTSKNEIFIANLTDGNFKKFVILSMDAQSFVMAYGNIDAFVLDTIVIPKFQDYNFTYFSFDNGGQLVQPEPPKNSWDIVFTRYRYVYYDLDNFTYLVSGVLLNPNNTSAMVDSINHFNNIQFDNSFLPQMSSNRDVIGFDWKKYNFDNGKYEVKTTKNYVVRNQQNHFWKIHFLDFYNNNGVKGSPSFEFERIQ